MALPDPRHCLGTSAKRRHSALVAVGCLGSAVPLLRNVVEAQAGNREMCVRLGHFPAVPLAKRVHMTAASVRRLADTPCDHSNRSLGKLQAALASDADVICNNNGWHQAAPLSPAVVKKDVPLRTGTAWTWPVKLHPHLRLRTPQNLRPLKYRSCPVTRDIPPGTHALRGRWADKLYWVWNCLAFPVVNYIDSVDRPHILLQPVSCTDADAGVDVLCKDEAVTPEAVVGGVGCPMLFDGAVIGSVFNEWMNAPLVCPGETALSKILLAWVGCQRAN
jgi:hypothetical protein